MEEVEYEDADARFCLEEIMEKAPNPKDALTTKEAVMFEEIRTLVEGFGHVFYPMEGTPPIHTELHRRLMVKRICELVIEQREPKEKPE